MTGVFTDDNFTQILMQYNFYEHYPNLHVLLLERSPGIFVFFFFTPWSTGKSLFHGLFSSELCGFDRNRILVMAFCIVRNLFYGHCIFLSSDNINPDQSIMTKLKCPLVFRIETYGSVALT